MGETCKQNVSHETSKISFPVQRCWYKGGGKTEDGRIFCDDRITVLARLEESRGRKIKRFELKRIVLINVLIMFIQAFYCLIKHLGGGYNNHSHCCT